MDSALKDAIFAVADLSDTRSADVRLRIRDAIGEFRAFIGTPAQKHECWIEIEGLDSDSLPATFGATRFSVVGDEGIEDLRKGFIEGQTIDDTAQTLSAIDSMGGEIRGRTVAIGSVLARDAAAALALAARQVRSTVECINFFADVIPSNRARLRIPVGGKGSGSSVRMAVTDHGAFSYSPEAEIPWTLSLDRLSELAGPSGKAVERVDALLARQGRSEIEELLLRAVRCCGRATDAESLEDKFLFSMIALETLTLPKRVRNIRQHLASRSARILGRGDSDSRDLEREIKGLYDIRSRLVHDGSLEVKEDDCARGHSIALTAVVLVLVSPEVQGAHTLDEMHDYLRSA